MGLSAGNPPESWDKAYRWFLFVKMRWQSIGIYHRAASTHPSLLSKTPRPRTDIARSGLFNYHQAAESAKHKSQAGDAHIMDRRTFATLLVGSIAVPRSSWEPAQSAKAKTVFYSSVGGDLT